MNDTYIRNEIKRAVNTRLSGLEADPLNVSRMIHKAERNPIMKRKISAGTIAAIALILVTVTVFAVGGGSLFRQLLGKEKATEELSQMYTPVKASDAGDHLNVNVKGLIYDGEKLAVDFEVENGQPAQAAYIWLRSLKLNDTEVWVEYCSASEESRKLVPDPRLDELPVDRNPVSCMLQACGVALSGKTDCEMTFVVERPNIGIVFIEDADKEDTDEAYLAELADRRAAFAAMENVIVSDTEHRNADEWAKEGYTVTYNGIPDNPETLSETAQIVIRFSFDAASGDYEYAPKEDISLANGTLRINRLRISPLTTSISLTLFPTDNSMDSAEMLAEKYGSLYLTDDSGNSVVYSNMDYLEGNTGFATETNGHCAVQWYFDMPGLKSFPDTLVISSDGGEMYRFDLK